MTGSRPTRGKRNHDAQAAVSRILLMVEVTMARRIRGYVCSRNIVAVNGIHQKAFYTYPRIPRTARLC